MLFPIFVVVTLAEIYVLVSVGQAIGGLSTVLLVIITAFIGSSLLRQQGWSTMAKAQQSMAEGRTPAMEMLEGVVILVSGILLLTPWLFDRRSWTSWTDAMEQALLYQSLPRKECRESL